MSVRGPARATIVDPGPERELFTACFMKYDPELSNKIFTSKYPELFPLDAKGAPQCDHIATLLELAADPSKVPASYSTLSQHVANCWVFLELRFREWARRHHFSLCLSRPLHRRIE
jgi:hypothetical protein